MSRLADLIKEARKKPQFHSGLEFVMSSLENIKDLIVDTAERIQTSAASKVSQDTTREHLIVMRDRALKLITKLADDYSLNRLQTALNTLTNKSQDEQWTGFLNDSKTLWNRMLEDLDYLQSDDYRNQVQTLMTRLKDQRDVYDQVQVLLQETSGLLDAIGQDRLLKEYAQDWNDLMVSLFLNERGRPTLKTGKC